MMAFTVCFATFSFLALHFQLIWLLLKSQHKSFTKIWFFFFFPRYRHPNIMDLVGYSVGGGTYCLIYVYMPSGSLEDRLRCEVKPSHLWKIPFLQMCAYFQRVFYCGWRNGSSFNQNVADQSSWVNQEPPVHETRWLYCMSGLVGFSFSFSLYS